MRNDDKTGVSERLFQEGVNYFIRHTDKWVSRSELQEALGIGKTQACKLCDVLSLRLALIQAEQEYKNSPLKLMLQSSSLQSATKELASISTLTNDDRMMLSILMNMADSTGLYGDMVRSLKSHISMSRFSERGIIPMVSYSPEMQTGGAGRQFIPLMLQAIEEGKSVWVTYKRLWYDKEKEYTVNPIGLFTQNDNLYLFSYNPHFEHNVVHAVSRIKKIKLAEKASTPEEFKDLSLVLDPFGIAIDDKAITVTAWIDHWQAPYEIEAARTRNAAITEHEDGSMTITVRTRNRFACKRWLMSLGQQAKCLSPSDLAQEIQREHATASAMY